MNKQNISKRSHAITRRFHQHKIVKWEDFDNTACHFLEQNLKETLGDNVKINFEFVHEIPREKSGKLRLIKSNIH